MLDAVLRLVVEFVLYALAEFVGFTGRVLVRGLSFGYLSVPEGRNRPFAIYWHEGQRVVVNDAIVVLIGWAFWIALFVCTILLFR